MNLQETARENGFLPHANRLGTLRGHQKRVVALSRNEKYYLAGAPHRGTGKVSYVGGNSKGSSFYAYRQPISLRKTWAG